MSRDEAYLLDILDAAKLAVSYVAGMTREEFSDNIQCQDAVIRRLAVMGEAARRVSEQMQSRLPDVPWRVMRGIRNILIHEYDNVDLDVIWDTTQADLPGLIAILEKVVRSKDMP